MTTERYDTDCEYALEFTREGGRFCGKPSVFRYEASGGGYMHLCEEHGKRHEKYAEHVTRGPGEHYWKSQH